MTLGGHYSMHGTQKGYYEAQTGVVITITFKPFMGLYLTSAISWDLKVHNTRLYI